MICPHCGTEMPDSARFCRKCGTQIEEKSIAKNKTEGEFSKSNQTQKKSSKLPVGIAIVVGAVLFAVIVIIMVFDLSEKDQQDFASSKEQQSSVAAQSAELKDDKQFESKQSGSESMSILGSAEETVEQQRQQEILITPSENGMATLTLRQRKEGEWDILYECTAAIGRNGTTDSPREGDEKTPVGTFPVLFCYGLEQPQTGIEFVKLQSDNVWVDDSESEYYNCLTTRQQAGNASFEDTYSQFTRGYYSYNIFFANNGDGRTPGSATSGMGSVRVLEGSLKQLAPTNGDIKITAQDMEAVLEILEARFDPVVTVVG